MPVINLFPLTILQEKISLDKNIKNEMVKEVQSMVKKSKNESYQSTNNSWTGDTQGFEYICRNEKFKSLFQEIKKKIINYLNILKVDENLIDIYITRSWATLSDGDQKIDKHKHLQSHISFAYYLKKNEKDSNIIFYDDHYRNEFIPALFTSKTLRERKIVKETNILNTPTVDISVNEDDIVIFPSKTAHGTQKNKNNDERISISGDIVCVAKNSELLEHIMPPINNWDKL